MKKTYIEPHICVHKLSSKRNIADDGDIDIGIGAVSGYGAGARSNDKNPWSDDSDAASGGSSSNGSIWSEGW